MNLLELLSNYDCIFASAEAYQTFSYQITDIITSYNCGDYGVTTNLMEQLASDINDFIKNELICDYIVTYDCCALETFDGNYLSVI